MAPELLVDLIGHLYDAAVNAELWSGMAGRIAHAFESTSAVIKFQDAVSTVQLLEHTDNMEVADHLQGWAQDWHLRDLWVHRSVAYGLDRIVTDEMLVTLDEQRKSGFYGEFLKHFDIHHMLGAVFPTGEEAIGVLGIHRPKGASAYGEEERRRAALFLPHLERAVRLGRQLSRARLAETAALEAMNRLDTAILVVDAPGIVVYANALAETLLRGGNGIGTVGGRLQLDDAWLHRRMAQLVRDAVAAAAGRPAAGAPAALLVPRLDRLPLSLSVAPLRPGWSRGIDPGPLALVFVKDPEAPSLHIATLCALFGFTPTEGAIAAELGAGRPLDAIAARQGIGIGTARWHLKNILAKTRTSRQAEAVALLARSVAASVGSR
ncbi:helix-turn-helix transcriptional regulator [Flavisphingomonas formosensis]|uniref:helix-turn-helix transcriptional regulator n=1 Tax=Flavisphingomonas formosensis TaxID=861534 RepID=UPI0012FB80E6|nr:helix-turn-helix transcriptional regulator [Sphingomonas formosensis]